MTSRNLRAILAFPVCLLLCCLVLSGVVVATDRSSFKFIEGGDAIAYDQRHKQIFVVKSEFNSVDVYSTVDFTLIARIPVGYPTGVDVSPDGSTLAVVNSTSYIQFYDTQTLKLTDRFQCVDHFDGLEAITKVSEFLFTSDGNAVVTVNSDTSKLNLATGALTKILSDWTHMSRSTDGSKVTFRGPGYGYVYDVASGQLTPMTLIDPVIQGIAANHDGTRFAVCKATEIYLLDQNLNIVQKLAGKCSDVIFSRDGSKLFAVFDEVNPDGTPSVLYPLTGVDVYDGTTLGFINTAASYAQENTSTKLATDETGLIYRIADKTLFAIDTTAAAPGDTTNFYMGMKGAGLLPADTVLNVPTRVRIDGTFTTGVSVELGGKNVPIDSFIVDPPGIYFTAPASATPKLVDAVVKQRGFRRAFPASFSYGMQIIRVVNNIGSPQGGDIVDVECVGAGGDASKVLVRFGGVLGTTISDYVRIGDPFYTIRVKTPPGAPGWVDVEVSSQNGTSKMPHAFQYAKNSKIFSIQGTLSNILHDRYRDRVYVTNADQVEVIDPNTAEVLAPLLPPGGKRAGSSFKAMALSLDGSRLYVVDSGTAQIFAMDPNGSGSGESIDIAGLLGATAIPAEVALTSTNKLLVGVDTAQKSAVYEYDLASHAITLMQGVAWGLSTTLDGNEVVATGTDGSLVLLNNKTGARRSIYQAGGGKLSFSDEGGMLVHRSPPVVLDKELRLAGRMRRPYSRDTWEDPSQVANCLHSSGGLAFEPNPSNPTVIEGYDLRRGQMAASIVFPEGIAPLAYTSYFDRHLAVDQSGRRLFGITISGVTMMELLEIPVTVGEVQPDHGTSGGGNVVKVRGTGFQPGAVVSFGDVAGLTTYVNETTLNVVVPALTVGLKDVTITNPNGSYTAPGVYTVGAVLGNSSISSLTPSSVDVWSSTTTVTIQGANFYPGSIARVNNSDRFTQYLDASALQIEISKNDLKRAGTLAITVYSPNTGETTPSANFTVTNPVPQILSAFPTEIVTGTNGTQLTLIGQGLAPGSVVQWNGIDLPTSDIYSSNTDITATVPASYLAADTAAQVTVKNPPPNGGSSNAVTVNVGPPTPVLEYPASIDLGSVVIPGSIGNSYVLRNIGTADMNISAFTVVPSEFQVYGCKGVLARANVCLLSVTVRPSVVGPINGTITISDDARGNPHVIAVSGVGLLADPPAVRIVSVTTTKTSANVMARVDSHGLEGKVWLEWGTSPTQLNSEGEHPLAAVNGDQSFNFTISGLSPGTNYSVDVAASTQTGVSRSWVQTFTTEASDPAFEIGAAAGGSTTAVINAGETATYSLALTGANGYSGTASLSCSGAPMYSACTVLPTVVSVSSEPRPFTVTVSTVRPTTSGTQQAASFSSSKKAGHLLVMALFAALGLMYAPARRGSRGMLMLIVVAFGFLTSCGGGGGGSSTATTPRGTTAGTYTMTLTATSGTLTKTLNLTMTVR